MAITDLIYNSHVKKMALNAMSVTVLKPRFAQAKAAVDYMALGPGEEEAGRKFLYECYQLDQGHDPTSSPEARHLFKHWMVKFASGQEFEAF